ncbi:uncharacterized protein LTR77_004520 [Saxophila tyrrhenica]|uniref:Uncharacterized protein n=1 Tax=Saxophila tyrrhenica TaxID=1690608 RepID=A0AAV9PDB9_9PEZI|nr:hypothetical protein LTR77_004520 [Saxophila tyrrhenica]
MKSSKSSGDDRYKSNSFSDYWMLANSSDDSRAMLRTQLRAKGYENKTLQREQLAELFRISQHRFIESSLIAMNPPRNKPTKKMFVEALIEADKRRTYPKLLDFPAELRQAICEFYISDFANPKDGLYCPSQPPLVRTCRTLRRDVLPIFYRKVKFQVDYIYTASFSLKRDKPTLPGSFPMSSVSTAFFSRMPPNHFVNLRVLRITFPQEYAVGDAYWRWRVSNLAVDIDERSSPALGRLLSVHPRTPHWNHGKDPRSRLEEKFRTSGFFRQDELGEIERAMDEAVEEWHWKALEETLRARGNFE